MVTGAAAGLGRAEAIGLARRRNGRGQRHRGGAGRIRRHRRDHRRRVKAVAVAGDISQRATADELVETADGLGGLGIVVNNAGITRDRMLFNMTDDDWDTVIAVHLRGHFLLTRNAATYWRRRPRRPSRKAGDIGQRRLGLRPHHQHVVGGRAGGPVGQANYGAPRPASPR